MITWILSVRDDASALFSYSNSTTGEHEDAECLDALYRVQMITESAYESQRGSRQASRAPSIHEVEREDSESTAASITTADTESRTKISLDTKVSAGGTNFSSGQRQLIAMVCSSSSSLVPKADVTRIGPCFASQKRYHYP